MISPGSTNETPGDNNSNQPPDAQPQSTPSGVKRRRSSSHAVDRPAAHRTTSMVSQHAPVMQNIQPQQTAQSAGAVASQDAAKVNATTAAHQSHHSHNHQQSQPQQHHHESYQSAPNMPPQGTHAQDHHRLPYGMGEFGSMDDYHRNVLNHSASINGQQLLHSNQSMPNAIMHNNNTAMQHYQHQHQHQQPYTGQSPHSQSGQQQQPMGTFRMPESPLSATGFMGPSPNAGSPGWLNLPSPSMYPNLQSTHPSQLLKYPVLRPILPRIVSIIPISLACDLLDLYFATSSGAFFQPASPYILGFVIRKRSVLRQTDPRPCSPALLVSMLWVGAQTSESSFLTSPPSQRGKICHQLLELAISLLNPLVHTSSDPSHTYGAHSVINGVALGGFGMANPAAGHDTEGGSTGATAALDDVITYINMATVVSASEHKAASLRWWNAAWSLARELRLGRELPPNPTPQNQNEDGEVGANPDYHQQHPNMPQPGLVTEEEREERRRIWWLLYTVDRHLALCYNRPLFLLDVECDGLLQPDNDTAWQSGEYFPPENYEQSLYFRTRGPSFQCTSHSMFGYFTPLMTILGEIVDLNHAKNHPRFGMRFRSGHEWEAQAAEISSQLDAYGHSLKEFESRFVPPEGEKMGNGEHHEVANSPHGSTSTSATRMTEAVLQTKVVVAYGTHLMHTLHILLNGKWDPISLLDDNDLWISSQSFISATSHAVSAAEAIGDILEYDPDLSFMPFFFGIYLLQGSFLLLLIADKLQGEASPSVVKACETIVRAHEVCVVTLNTEYQVRAPKSSDHENNKLIHMTEKFPQSHALGACAG